jgi:hypothetical protein
MKKWLLLVAMALTFATGLLILEHNEPSMNGWNYILGVGLCIIGLTLFLWTGILFLNQPSKVYRFLHYYWNSDTVNDVDTTIISKLSTKQITQLKNIWFDYNRNPILIDKIHRSSFDCEAKTRVTGWIQAIDKAEAIRTLKYNDWDKTV